MVMSELKASVIVAIDDDPVTFVNLFKETVSSNRINVTQRIGTAEEAVELGDLTSADLVVVKNLDPTNYVTLYNISGGTPFSKLLPGEAHVFRLFTVALYAKADTAECKIQVLAFET
jgi:hypothetical protein